MPWPVDRLIFTRTSWQTSSDVPHSAQVAPTTLLPGLWAACPAAPGELRRTAEGHAEVTQRSEVYLCAKHVALDRANFIPGEIFFFFH